MVLAASLAVGSVLASPFAARAQQGESASAHGISVIGYGEGSAPAETAIMQIVVSDVNFGQPVAPDPDAVPGESERKAVRPLVEALVAAGIPEGDIDIVVSLTSNQYYGPGGPGVVRVDLSVDEPTTGRIDELISAAIVGAAEKNLVVGLVGVGFGVTDCAALEREARAAAFGDAEDRADLQAEVMGVERGGVLSSSDMRADAGGFDPYFGAFSSSRSSCSPPVPAVSTSGGTSLPAYDPAGEAEVSVYAQLAVTFAVADPQPGATPTA